MLTSEWNNNLGEHTKLVKASSKFESLRTTVPKSLVKLLKLKEGDMLDWDLTAKDNKLVLTVEKVQDEREREKEREKQQKPTVGKKSK
jgi:bifunctional DNA-binding transcriptional regulator/antitoxin component of YhaV-PrlF toxin-antitoxin module